MKPPGQYLISQDFLTEKMEVHLYIGPHFSFLIFVCIFFSPNLGSSSLVVLLNHTLGGIFVKASTSLPLFVQSDDDKDDGGANVMMALMKVMALDICDACELSDVQIGKNMTMEICFLVTQRNGLKSIVSDDYDIEDKRALTLTTMKTLETKKLTDFDYVDHLDDVDDVDNDNEDVEDR